MIFIIIGIVVILAIIGYNRGWFGRNKAAATLAHKLSPSTVASPMEQDAITRIESAVNSNANFAYNANATLESNLLKIGISNNDIILFENAILRKIYVY